MNANTLKRLGFLFAGNLAWVAVIMYAATKLDPLNEYLALLLYWLVPLWAYLLVLNRADCMLRVHRAVRLTAIGIVGFGLSLVALVIVGLLYSLSLSYALSNL
jgi:hypothetical protein